MKHTLNINYLESLRIKNGYTQLQMGALLGKHKTYYSSKIQGLVRFSAEDIAKLIDLYDLKEEDIAKLFTPGDTHNDTNNSRKDQD